MILGLVILFVYIASIILCTAIFIERCVEPSPISVFIWLCPIINTIYCIYRLSSLGDNWKSWFKDL